MIRRTVTWFLFAALFVTAPATAQQVDTLTTSLRPGARSLSIGANIFGSGSGGEFQYWHMRSERTNLGLVIALYANYQHSERDTPTGGDDSEQGLVEISAGPALRRYATTTAKVNPFVYGHALVSYGIRTHQGAGSPKTYVEQSVGGQVASGIGAEWFPVRSISFSGQTGFLVGAQYGSGEAEPLRTEGFLAFGRTFTSALLVNLYWPQRTR